MNYNLIFIIIINMYLIELNSQTINFVNINLKNLLLTENCVDTNNDDVFDTKVDANNDGEIQLSEAQNIASLKIDDLDRVYFIESIEDIAHFTNLEKLKIFGNDELQFISNLGLLHLTHFWLDGSANYLTYLDISDLPNIVNLRIEGPFNLEYLNLKNGSYATEYFSLFYTENIQFACVDAIEAEYNETALHMINGALPTTNCTTTSVNEELTSNVEMYPNPTSNKVYFSNWKNITSIKMYNKNGQLLYQIKDDFESTNIAFLEKGIYFIQIINQHHKIYKKLIIK